MAGISENVMEKAVAAVCRHDLARPDTPVLLMVSGGSDSTALAYICAQLAERGELGQLCMLHVNHRLRGADSDADAVFVEQLARKLGMGLVSASIDVGALAEAERGNVEAIARRERYGAARKALSDMCRKLGVPVSDGRIFVAHTADDRIENFYMRSIVGTGPGGFRSMLYLNGQVARPLLDLERDQLRAYIAKRAEDGMPVARDGAGALWREDATNQHTDRFRAFVRHEMVPLARERNPRLATTLTRTMNLIAAEDDMLDSLADELRARHVAALAPAGEGFVLAPQLAQERKPLVRRVVVKVLEDMLDPNDRIETASVDAVLAAFEGGKPVGGYVANVQGNLAVSANKQGVRIEPMAAFRTRRKRA